MQQIILNLHQYIKSVREMHIDLQQTLLNKHILL